MAYSTEEQVQAQFPLTVSLTHIEGYIAEADGEIDALLAGAGYATPVDTPLSGSGLLIQRLSIYKAGLACWDEADSTERTAVPFAGNMIRDRIAEMELGINNGALKLDITRIDFGPTMGSEDLQTSTISHFNLSEDIDLVND